MLEREPYRLFFPLGILFLLLGALVWVPLIWTADEYPVLFHRTLMLNGFAGSFIGGFLMTAVPRFSETKNAVLSEIVPYLIVTLAGLFFAYEEQSQNVFICSLLQPVLIMKFILPRMLARKKNPPPGFVFIFLGLLLWVLSGLLCLLVNEEQYKALHYEGAIVCIILGVGSRLLPAILGHQEILAKDTKSLPIVFVLLLLFAGSYFLPERFGDLLRTVVILIVGLSFWKLYKLPKVKTALTWSLWSSGILIVMSFVLKTLWPDGMIHASHAFFINGIVLMSLLIGTRVIVSHGGGGAKLENSKILYLVTSILIVAGATRVSAFLMPDHYLSHLAYSAILLVVAVVIWSGKFLRPSLVWSPQKV